MQLTGIDFIFYGAALLILLMINALLVACEISMVKVRYSLIDDEQMERLRKSRRVALLLDRSAQVAQVLRFGVLMVTVGLGLVLIPLIFYLASKVHWFAEQPGKSVLFFLAYIFAVSVLSMFGFVLPRSIALAHPLDTLRFTSKFVLIFVRLITPWSLLVRTLAKAILSLFKLPLNQGFNVLDYEVQIRAMGEEDVTLSPRIRNILSNALRVRELDVSDVLLPRNQVKYIDTEDSVEVNLEMARETGHTRFPVCHGDLDRCFGLIHIKDIFRQGDRTVDFQRLTRTILSFEESTPLEEALEQLLQHNIHMAIVKDEFGGALGLVTLEGILEVLVGDIQDEFDGSETAMVHSLSKEDFHVDGLTPLHDLEEALGISVGETEAATFGGWITDELGRMPEAGESIITETPPLQITIQEADEKRILSANITVLPDKRDGEE